MQVTTIPFVAHLGIQEEQNSLTLEPSQNLENHLGTIHASAQFTLAETQSGLFLQTEFSDIQGEVIPLLRGSTVKYKSSANSKLIAHASMNQEAKNKFIEQFSKKGRATITVMVEVKDENATVTMTGEFHWFIQQLNVSL